MHSTLFEKIRSLISNQYKFELTSVKGKHKILLTKGNISYESILTDEQFNSEELILKKIYFLESRLNHE